MPRRLFPRGSEGEGASAEGAEGETNFYRVKRSSYQTKTSRH